MKSSSNSNESDDNKKIQPKKTKVNENNNQFESEKNEDEIENENENINQPHLRDSFSENPDITKVFDNTKIQKHIGYLKNNIMSKDLGDHTSALHSGMVEIKDAVFKLYKIDVEIFERVSSFIINWMLFPIWSLEQIPVVGNFVTIPLDIYGVMLSFSEVVFETIGEVFPEIVDMLLDIGQAIPGVGTALSAVAVPINFMLIPIQYFIENFPSIIDLYVNIARKNWALAYLGALSTIPYFDNFMDIFITYLTSINKYFSKLNNMISESEEVVEYVDNFIEKYI